MTFQKRTWEILEIGSSDDLPSRVADVLIFLLILLNVAAFIFGTVPEVGAAIGTQLRLFEMFSVAVFTIEYLGRLWSCTTVPAYGRPVAGRLRFARTPLAVIDLLAILPFYLAFLGVDLRFLRVIRLIRVLRVARLSRYLESLNLFGKVVHNKREELIMTTTVVIFLLILSSSFMYYAEVDAQPEAFSSIPATMWWAVATLTTVGYGDIYPITVLGKLVGSFVAVLGIGLFALPTAILGSGLVEEIQKRKDKREPKTCPHCGKPPE